MSEIKCQCGINCKVKIRIEVINSDINLWFTDSRGHQTLMYLTPNSVVELIHSLKRALNEVI